VMLWLCVVGDDDSFYLCVYLGFLPDNTDA
jgi:hypothetical protein